MIPETSEQIPVLLYSWGKNKDGELGLEHTRNDVIEPSPVNFSKNHEIVAVSSGRNHSALVTTAGHVFVAGSTLHGKLGLEDIGKVFLSRFTLLTAIESEVVIQVACGDYHTMALTTKGTVWTWGGSLFKKLGSRGSSHPSSVPSLQYIKQVGCGDFHSMALSEDGTLYSWGGGGHQYNKGQCGHGNFEDNETPMRIEFFAKEKKQIGKFSCGGFHTVAITCKFLTIVSGLSYMAMGKQLTMRLTDGEQVSVGNQGLIIQDAKCGGKHTIFLTVEGLVFTTGYGSHGQLGLKTNANVAEPQLVYPLSNKKCIAIAAGWNHSIVLISSGRVFACGYGKGGELGIGDKESYTSFTEIPKLRKMNVSRISAGGYHTWALLNQASPIHYSSEPSSPLRVYRDTASPKPFVFKSQNIIPIPAFHVVYSDVTAFSHRFIRFSCSGEMDKLLEITQTFVDEVKANEQGVIFHKLQADAEVILENDKVTGFSVSHFLRRNEEEEEEKEKVPFFVRTYTLMVIVDLKKGIIPIERLKVLKADSKLHFTKTKMKGGDLFSYEIEEAKGDPVERQLTNWIVKFKEMFHGRFFNTKFFEIRPTALKPIES